MATNRVSSNDVAVQAVDWSDYSSDEASDDTDESDLDVESDDDQDGSTWRRIRSGTTRYRLYSINSPFMVQQSLQYEGVAL